MNSESTDDSFTANATENREIIFEYDQKFKKKETENIKDISKSNIKLTRQTAENFFVKNIYEKFGSLYISDKKNKILFISRIKMINFPIKRELFEKGKSQDLLKGNETQIGEVPEIKFWHQRYYYYSKYDKGIQMDTESK